MNTYKEFLEKLQDYTFHIFYKNSFLIKKRIENFPTFLLLSKSESAISIPLIIISIYSYIRCRISEISLIYFADSDLESTYLTLCIRQAKNCICMLRVCCDSAEIYL